MIIAGFSAYARHLDYARFRQICDGVNALLLAGVVKLDHSYRCPIKLTIRLQTWPTYLALLLEVWSLPPLTMPTSSPPPHTRAWGVSGKLHQKWNKVLIILKLAPIIVRSGMIFYRRGQKSVDKKGNPVMYDFEQRINNAVFPALQVRTVLVIAPWINYRAALTITQSVV